MHYTKVTVKTFLMDWNNSVFPSSQK